MRIIGQAEAYLYSKKGYNINMLNNGTSVNMGEIYSYLKRNQKTTGELTRSEYLMFKKSGNNN